MPKNILLVEDNPIIKKKFSEIISTGNDFELTLFSGTGSDTIAKVFELKPDLLVMDSELSYCDIIATINYIMHKSAMPIVVIADEVDASIAYTALSNGALEVLSKREILSDLPENINSKLKLLSEITVIQHPGAHNIKSSDNNLQILENLASCRKVVVVGSSTGGPKALSQLLSAIPENISYPIIIAQHLSSGFTESFVGWLSQGMKLKIKVPVEGESPKRGYVYVIPPEKHMIFSPNRTMTFIDPGTKDIYHPSCDKLFLSAAEVFGHNTIGIILTGMGDDGAEGIKKIKEVGGYTIAQDEESSFIFGMPKSSIDTGCIDKVFSLTEITEELIRVLK